MVALAYWLGANWLASPVLGIPLGVWAIPVCVATVRWGDRIVLDRWLRRVADTATGLTTNLSGRLGEQVASAAAPIRGLGERLTSSRSDDDGRVRVGLALDADAAARVMAFASGVAQFVVLDRGQASRQVAQQLGLDAILADRGEEGWRITLFPPFSTSGNHYPTAYPSASPNAWADWSLRRRLSYATVFPSRLDADHVSLGRPQLTESFEAELLAALSESAAALARAAEGTDRRAVRPSLMRLSDLVVRAAVRRQPPMAAVPAARVAGAWLATYDGPLPLEQRSEGIEAAAVVLGHDAESLLRAAAVRFAIGEDESGFEALERCEDQLQVHGIADFDQLPFVMSELECGSEDDVMLVGRVAAGLRLACSTLDARMLETALEDTSDDIRHAKVLTGRDPEAALLLRVLRRVAQTTGAQAAA